MSFTGQGSRVQSCDGSMVTERLSFKVSEFQGLESIHVVANRILRTKEIARRGGRFVDFETLQLCNLYPFASRFFKTSSALFSCSSIVFFGFTSFFSSGVAT